MVIYYLKKAKAWFTLAVLSASLFAPMQTKAQRVAVKTNAQSFTRLFLKNSFCLAVKTNALYWAASTPNLGAEFRVNRHVTFNFEAAYNRIKVFNIDTRGAMITPEVRYWFSARPQTGHFVGIAGIGCHYNYVRGGNRHKGDLYGGGVTYGYSFVLSRRWSLETTLGVGMAHVQEMSWDKDEYEPGEANVKGWRPIPIKAGVTFVYLIK